MTAKTKKQPKAKTTAKKPDTISKKTPLAPMAVSKVPIKIKADKKNHVLPDDFDLKQTSSALSTLVTHIQDSRQNSLFEDAPVRINLDVTAVKVPEGLGHFVNINLPNSPYPPEPEILFIIPDGKKGADPAPEPEQLVGQMKDKLRERGVTGIREVMTVKQVKSDFSTFEAKRALAKRIDVVIGMKSIFTLLPPILGREFYRKKKSPLELELHDDDDDWPALFETVLRKSVFNISLQGRTSTVLVGHTNLTSAELLDNLSKIVNWLLRLYPGGWKNVSQLSLSTNANGVQIPPLLIYVGRATRKDIPKAVTRGRQVAEPVAGELSTGKKVRIHPYGQIDVLGEQSDDSGAEDLEAEQESNSQAQGADAEEKPAAEGGRRKKKKSDSDMNNAEKKYVEAVFRRQEFEDSQSQSEKQQKQKKRKAQPQADGGPKKPKTKIDTETKSAKSKSKNKKSKSKA